jgi:hypothetical protein
MDYNTETVNRIAEEFAKLIKEALDEQQEVKESRMTIAEIETGMREGLRQIGLQALGKLLSALQKTPESKIECACGGELDYQRMRTATVISVFGRATYERAYYAGCGCQKGKAPLDEAYGLEPGAVTSGLGALLALAGIEFSFESSPKWLKNYLLFEVSENTVRSETEKMGGLQEQQEKELIERSQNESDLQERQRKPGKVPSRLYGSMDAAKVRIEPRPKQGEKPEKEADWRDMKVLSWYEVETVPPAQRSKRHLKKATRDQPALRAKQMRYSCDIIAAHEFGKLLWATGCAVNADQVSELIFLGDGAAWIWKLVSYYYPKAIQIVDWYHAEEHLEWVAAAAFQECSARKVWLEEATQSLWDGQVEEVIRACQSLADWCPVAHDAVTYFTNNMERMRYETFRAAGYLIGSGTIESACKQIVSHRLKVSGAQWEVPGAVQTAKARAAWLSGDWQSLCELRAALPLAI